VGAEDGVGHTVTFDDFIARARSLSDDVDLTAVAQWKARAEGRKAIGHMPTYVPRELIHASGMLAVGIGDIRPDGPVHVIEEIL